MSSTVQSLEISYVVGETDILMYILVVQTEEEYLQLTEIKKQETVVIIISQK